MNLLEIKWFTDARLTKKKKITFLLFVIYLKKIYIYFYYRLFVLKFYQHDI